MCSTERERLPKLLMRSNEFVDRFNNLPPGESFIYHRGHLAVDKSTSHELNLISNLAVEFQEQDGKAELVHKRIGNDFWEYIIIKRRKVKK